MCIYIGIDKLAVVAVQIQHFMETHYTEEFQYTAHRLM